MRCWKARGLSGVTWPISPWPKPRERLPEATHKPFAALPPPGASLLPRTQLTGTWSWQFPVSLSLTFPHFFLVSLPPRMTAPRPQESQPRCHALRSRTIIALPAEGQIVNPIREVVFTSNRPDFASLSLGSMNFLIWFLLLFSSSLSSIESKKRILSQFGSKESKKTPLILLLSQW